MQTIEFSETSGPRARAHELDCFLARLRAGHERFLASDQGDLGSLEEQLQRDAAELLRARLQSAAQAKADSVPPHCPKCGRKLSRQVEASVTIQTRYGPIQIRRVRGWCSKCKEWHCPADQVLNIATGRSPYVQEAA